MTTRILLAVVWVLWMLILPVTALDPISFEEISLLLRVGEQPAAVLKEIEKRKILRPLTPLQVNALKSVGAPDTFLTEIQRPERLAHPEIANDVELRKLRQKEAQASNEHQPETLQKPSQMIASTPVAPTGRELFIEKIVILKDPLHQPFHVFFKASANGGNTEASHHIPGKTYVREGIEPKVEIPVNLVLHGVQENDWAKVTLHLDVRNDTVATPNAAKRHTARIPITDKPLYGKPFEFAPPRATFIVSLNTNQEFVYQVYWKIR